VANAPVLLLIFNRPDLTARVMEAIRAAQPPSLYVAADGPRDRPGEADLCQQSRQVATAVDWPCRVETLFRDRNLGCRSAVSDGITWFFENEPEGIVLEDDCLPESSFFPYCGELLERYRNDDRIMCITGGNYQNDMRDYQYSYYFSKYNHCWGWASWRRAWRFYDVEMASFPIFMRSGALDRMSPTPHFSKHWAQRFKRTYKGRVDTWDYQWIFCCWSRNGLTCTPRANLTSNIGHRPDGTHWKGKESAAVKTPVHELSFPLVHPERVATSEEFDAHVDVTHFGIKPTSDPWGRKAENWAKRGLRALGLKVY
jgi:hypothetical protein